MIAFMGFTMTFKSFMVAFKERKGFGIGIILNLILAPLICYFLSLSIPESDIAVGIILIGVVPCAGMALVWTGLLNGHIPLAAAINIGTMILAPLLIPLLMILLAGNHVQINILDMFLQLIYTILIPLLVGIFCREILEQKNKNVKKWQPISPASSGICAVFLMFISVNNAMLVLLKNMNLLAVIIFPIVALFPILFAVAYLISIKIFDRKRNIALAYSSGMKNLPIALGIAMISFGPIVALSIAIGFTFQSITAVGFHRILVRNSNESSIKFKENQNKQEEIGIRKKN